jgi:hypothetical protein
LPRRKTQRLHGDVTVIRPEPPSVIDSASQEKATPPKPSIAASFSARAGESDFTDVDWPRYPKMLARLRTLELQADRLRRREAADAIRWIKRAIRTYRISISELSSS